MKQPVKHIALATLTATALGLSLVTSAFAQPPVPAQPTLLAANATVEQAEQAVSDTWITSKVKSSFIAEQSLSGLEIKVETNQGVVALSGVVASEAERDLAIAKTREIEGVKDVSADGLKTAE